MSSTTWFRALTATVVLVVTAGLGLAPASASPTPTLVPGGASVVEGDSGTQVVLVPVTLTAPASSSVTARWSTIFGSATNPPAPAQPGTDFEAASGTVTFPPGTTEATIGITVFGDEVVEPDEWIVVSFNDVTGAAIGGYLGLGFAVIEDDDAPVIQPGTASMPEGDSGSGTLAIPVTLNEPSDVPITVAWRTRFDPSVQPPVPAFPVEDFAPASGTLTFPPGTTAATIGITVFGDEAIEPDEWIVVQLQNPTNATLGGFWGLGFGVIEDDDAPPVISSTGTTPVTVREGDSGTTTLTLPVHLSRPSSEVVTVDFATLLLNSADPPVATEGVDYEATTGTIVFAPGTTEATMSVPIIGDTLDEPDEYVLVGLRNPTNGVLSPPLSGGIGFGLIVDDDGP